MSKKKSSRNSPLMIDSAQQTDLRITENGNIVKSNQKLFTFYDYRDKMKKNVETSTSFYKSNINKKPFKVKFEDEDENSSESESSEDKSKYKNNKLNRKKSESMKKDFKYYRENSSEESDDDHEYHIQKGKKIIYLRESPQLKEETKIVYVRNTVPEVLAPSSSEKYIYQPSIAPMMVKSTPNVVTKTPSLVQIAPMKQPIQTLPFHSPLRYNTLRRNSFFK